VAIVLAMLATTMGVYLQSYDTGSHTKPFTLLHLSSFGSHFAFIFKVVVVVVAVMVVADVIEVVVAVVIEVAVVDVWVDAGMIGYIHSAVSTSSPQHCTAPTSVNTHMLS
jgi:hypothetical protein